MPGTCWCEPSITDPGNASFGYDADSFYWRFSLEAHRETLKYSRGRFLQQFPDLIEGLDTLAAMRGTERLLTDLLERPDWVRGCVERITGLYFHHYDVLYDLIRDEVGGSVYWVWAPGRLAKLQCDFSAMISPAMFREFMVPVLCEMTERVSYSLYHWDGPGALGHLDALLSVPGLDMIQWTPGAGNEPSWHRRWWPMFHRILDVGKRVFVADSAGREQLLDLRGEFGEQSKGMLVNCYAASPADANDMIGLMEM
jgi:5-methyltetrahydrofolate--homocysteine methyltransferase